MPSSGGGRRKFLTMSGKGLLGLFAGGFFNGAFSRQSSAAIFAGLFLEKNRAIEVPRGYYDEQAQLYVDARTRQPMFVEPVAAPAKPLAGEELQSLTESDWSAIGPDSPRTRMAQWCSLSRQTSYSTTRCCPIVTDTSSDTECDDTGPDPPPK
jgi:hypothetical protein